VKFFWEVFVTLFVIIDPPGTVPVFLGPNSAIAFAHGALINKRA
jgi:small neutral amino acid transporter SnatA (MarC family)